MGVDIGTTLSGDELVDAPAGVDWSLRVKYMGSAWPFLVTRHTIRIRIHNAREWAYVLSVYLSSWFNLNPMMSVDTS